MCEFESTEAANACARSNQTPAHKIAFNCAENSDKTKRYEIGVWNESAWNSIAWLMLYFSRLFEFFSWKPNRLTFCGIVAKTKRHNLSWVLVIAETKANHRSWWNRMTFRRKTNELFEPIAFQIGSSENRIDNIRVEEIAEPHSSKHVFVFFLKRTTQNGNTKFSWNNCVLSGNRDF